MTHKPDPRSFDLAEYTFEKPVTSGGGGNCPSVARAGDYILLIDDRDPAPVPTVWTIPEFAALVNSAKLGQYDRLLDQP